MVKKNYKPRITSILIFFSLLYFIIIIRLYLLQVNQKDFFKNLAEQQYQVELTINPARAKIVDRNNKIIATNLQTLSAFILPSNFTEKDKILKFLKKNYPDIYKTILNNKNKKFIWLERRLSPEKVNFLKKLELKDLNFIEEYDRFYPYKDFSTILGFTNIDNLGISGIELEFNKYLSGTPTILKLEKDARSGHFYFEKDILQQGEKGKHVKLTLDSNIQFIAYNQLKKSLEETNAKTGSVLILNPENGQILAMVNLPDFDPNQKNIINLENTKNRIITECFELGSVIKALTALAALEEKAVKPDELIDCEDKLTTYIQNFKVTTWKSCGIVTFSDVIKNSNNIGVAKVALRIGPKLYTHLTRLGLASKTGIEFPGERSGFVNPPNNWSRSSNIVMSFGYEIMATLLQLGKAFCIISNGGYDIKPTLILEPEAQPTVLKKKMYSDETIGQIKNILSTIGVSFNKGLEDYNVYGKTGTARIAKEGRYSNKEHSYTFAGIIEKGPYKRVIITFLQEPKEIGNVWASQIAAPMFNKIAEQMVIYENKG